jgi:hypothetical protein
MNADGDRIMAAQRAYRKRRRGKVQVTKEPDPSLEFILAMGRRRLLAAAKSRDLSEPPK